MTRLTRAFSSVGWLAGQQQPNGSLKTLPYTPVSIIFQPSSVDWQVSLIVIDMLVIAAKRTSLQASSVARLSLVRFAGDDINLA